MHETGSSPLVSIVVPAYGQMVFVTRALDSTLTSRLEPVGLLVCDDTRATARPISSRRGHVCT